jgi:HEPN domain-containing protein
MSDRAERLRREVWRWLRLAREDLAAAMHLAEAAHLPHRVACLLAQQAAEKAIKAVLIARGAAFPPIHDLAGLLTILGQNDETFPPAIAEAARLTRFAVSTRYPGVAEPVTVEEHHRAVAIAETVVTWADERVGEESSPTR